MTAASKNGSNSSGSESAKPKCGVVMPISAWGDHNEDHWADVLGIITEALEPEFDVRLVSVSDEVTVIHKTIVQNLATDDVVVCDVSGRNPNVMFELGLRLAFDRPTVVIKDHETPYSFDTSPIEHLGYPQDLHYQKILKFKADLLKKVQSTHKKRLEDSDFSPFLKHFGKYVPKAIETKEVPAGRYFEALLTQLTTDVNQIGSQVDRLVARGPRTLEEQLREMESRRKREGAMHFGRVEFPSWITDEQREQLADYANVLEQSGSNTRVKHYKGAWEIEAANKQDLDYVMRSVTAKMDELKGEA